MSDACGASLSEGGLDPSFPVEAPPLPGRVIFDQLWCDLAFLHWPVDPAQVERFMPAGVRPDVFDGVTYVGLVPFRMRRAGPGRHTPIPFFGDFLEWNVRLYSVDEQGRHGVVFRTLDATRFAVVAAARWGIRVPYVFSRIRADPFTVDRGSEPSVLPVGTQRHWALRRRFPGPGTTSRVTFRVGAAVNPTPLELFLTSRWGMHSNFGRTTLWVPNRHGAWPLHAAEDLEIDDALIAASEVSPIGPMLRPLWTPGVHALFAAPVRVGGADGGRR